MRKIIAIIRANEWWEYKLAPMLAMTYLTILQSRFTFYNLWPLITVSVTAIALGAIYVSLLNDATDVAIDVKAGKKNRMASFTTAQQTMLVLIPLAAGLSIVSAFMNFSFLASLFYISAFISFSLYSLPPFRLKKRGAAGIIADALGSQVFPTLFIVISFYKHTNLEIKILPLVLMSVWLLCFGLRGILWHQLTDKKNDQASGLCTLVQNLNEAQISRLSITIITTEIIAFATYILRYNLLSLIPGLLLYFICNWILLKYYHIEQILINPKIKTYRIFLFEYYQVFLPLSVLILCICKNPINVIGLLFHCLLFPSGILSIFRMIKHLSQTIITKILPQAKNS
jgi:hypothetical protein